MKTIAISMPPLMNEKQRRIIQAIAETQCQIDREMGYSEQFRKHDKIAQWKQHIINLQNMFGGV